VLALRGTTATAAGRSGTRVIRVVRASSSQLTTTTSSSPCFTVVAPRATARTRAVFAEHDLHGGGPTWGAILQATALRHGRDVRELEDPPPDYPGFGAPFAITTGAGVSWYTVDDESDAAVFCTPDTTLRAAVRHDVERADVDEAAREAAIAEAAAFGEE
jgi:hypothetical protein